MITILRSSCSYLNNQAYLLSKIPLPQRIEGFLKNSGSFSGKDKGALLLTLSPREQISKELSSGILNNLQIQHIAHKELSLIAQQLSLNQVQSQQLWKNIAFRGFKIIEDFDRDSLPRFLNAVDRSEQAEITQFWEAIRLYAERNYTLLNAECALALFCTLVRRFEDSQEQLPSSVRQSQENTNKAQHHKNNEIMSDDPLESDFPISEWGRESKSLSFETIFKNSSDGTDKMNIISMEQQQQQSLEDWEKQTNDIIFDLAQQIALKHAKNLTGEQLLQFISFLLECRPEWTLKKREAIGTIKTCLGYLENQLDSVDNFTLLFMTLLQVADKIQSLQPQLIMKTLHLVLKNPQNINSQNIHLIFTLLHALNLHNHAVYKKFIPYLLNHASKITSTELQAQIIEMIIQSQILQSDQIKPNMSLQVALDLIRNKYSSDISKNQLTNFQKQRN